jgi:plasmid maintenance system antidote protein VapI
LSEIIRGRRRITAATALRLGKLFGVSPRFRLGLQDDYDLEEQQEQLERIRGIGAWSASSITCFLSFRGGKGM